MYKFQPQTTNEKQTVTSKCEEDDSKDHTESEETVSSVDKETAEHVDEACSEPTTNSLERGADYCGRFRLLWKHRFSDPLFAIDSLDLIGDGLEELIVLTQSGVHVLQHDPAKAMQLCISRLKMAAQQQVPIASAPDQQEVSHDEAFQTKSTEFSEISAAN